MQDQKIAFIGGGNMAEALFSGIIKSGHQAGSIQVSDPTESRLDYLKETYQVSVSTHNIDVLKDTDIVVLAVKPQQMSAVLKEITAFLKPDMTVISIAAGIDIKSMQEMAGRSDLSIVRVMPNTPAMLGAGMSVLYSSADDAHRERAEYVLKACGEIAWLDDENLMHAATAVSGSGPAYFFLLAELMQGAAEALKLPPEIAQKLVRQTALGAGMMLQASDKQPSELRAQVTSPNGTTQAALDKMYETGFHESTRQGVVAAAKRSREMMG